MTNGTNGIGSKIAFFEQIAGNKAQDTKQTDTKSKTEISEPSMKSSSPSTGRTISTAPKGRGFGAGKTDNCIKQSETFKQSASSQALGGGDRQIKAKLLIPADSAKADASGGAEKTADKKTAPQDSAAKAVNVSRRIVLKPGQQRNSKIPSNMPPLPPTPPLNSEKEQNSMPPLPPVPSGSKESPPTPPPRTDNPEQPAMPTQPKPGRMAKKRPEVPDKELPPLPQNEPAQPANQRPTLQKTKGRVFTDQDLAGIKKGQGSVKAGVAEAGANVDDLTSAEAKSKSDPHSDFSAKQKTNKQNMSSVSNALKGLDKRTKLEVKKDSNGVVTISTQKRRLFGASGKSKESKESMSTILDVMETVMKNGPESAKKDVFSSYRSLKSNAWCKSILKQNPELKSKFNELNKNIPDTKMKPTETELNQFVEFAGKVAGDVDSMGYQDMADNLRDNRETLETILDNSGIKPTTTVEVRSRGRPDLGKIPLGELLGAVPSDHSAAAIMQDAVDHAHFLAESPEEGYTHTASTLTMDKQEHMKVVQKAVSGTVAGPSLCTTLAKQLDKCVDGFCREYVVDPEVRNKEGSDTLEPAQRSRQAMIDNRLGKVKGFENFVSDRNKINVKAMHILRQDKMLPELVNELIQDIKAFEDKYKPLAEANKAELTEIKKEIPPSIGFFTEAKDVKADDRYSQMLKEFPIS